MRHILSIQSQPPDQNTWQYKCDDQVFTVHLVGVRLCHSHCCTTAEINGHLTKFIDFRILRRHNCSPNLTQLAQHGMPASSMLGAKEASLLRKNNHEILKAPSEENQDAVD